jgi:hypothetical protein
MPSSPKNATEGIVYSAAVAALMGVSAAISGAGQQALWRRGLLLLLMEFTVVGWAWTFNPVWPRLFFQVIGALGVAMLALAVAVRLPTSLVAVAGLLIVAGVSRFFSRRLSLWNDDADPCPVALHNRLCRQQAGRVGDASRGRYSQFGTATDRSRCRERRERCEPA